MKRLITTLLFTVGLLTALAPAASADGHDLTGVDVQIDNTIQSVAFNFPDETPFGSQGPETIGAGVEFAECCDGFYAVDLSADQISMTWIGDDDTYARVIEDGTFDRYYFTFDEPVLAGASLNSASTLPADITVASATELLIVVGPGMEIGTGFDALIDVTVAEGGPSELASTGVSSWELAIIGATAIVGGAMLVTWSRREPAVVEY